MGLTAPASPNDTHTWTVTAQNLFLLDYHDHTPGKGSRLTGASIQPASLSGIHISSILQSINPSQVGILVGTASLSVPASSSTATAVNITFNQSYIGANPLIFVQPTFDSTDTYLLIPSASSVSTTGFTIGGKTTAAVGSASTFSVNWMAIPDA